MLVITEVHTVGCTAGCFSPLEAIIASSGTMAASPQGGGLQVRSSSGPPNLVSNVHCIFSRMDLPSTPGRKQRAVAITYLILKKNCVVATTFMCETLGCRDFFFKYQAFPVFWETTLFMSIQRVVLFRGQS